MGGKNTQHRYSTRFAAMLQNKLHAFCCLFFRTLRVSSSKFFLEIPISQTERSQELRLWSQRMKSMFCQLLPTTFIGATIGNFSFDARVWRVKFGAHDFAFRSRECKILSLKDCRHQNVDYFPSVINSYSFVFFLFFFSLPGGQLEKLMDDLHTELSSNPPLPGSYTARKGDLCAALFVDNNWYVSNSPPPPPPNPPLISFGVGQYVVELRE